MAVFSLILREIKKVFASRLRTTLSFLHPVSFSTALNADAIAWASSPRIYVVRLCRRKSPLKSPARVYQLISIAIEIMSESPDSPVQTIVRSSKTQLNLHRGGPEIEMSPMRGHNNPLKGENVNIQNVVRSISKKEIKNVQKKAKQHFEGGSGNSQMNMIAFD